MATHTIKHTKRKQTRRAHVVLPEGLLHEVDELVGPRGRSDFIAAAALEKLERERLRNAAHELAGFLRDVDTPHWRTPEDASEWVRSLRRESDSAVSSPHKDV